MANKWKISTTDKKSIVDHWFFVKNGDETKWAKVEELWRWGYVVVESMQKPKIDSVNADGFNIYDFDVWDQETDDGCGTWFEFSDSVSEDERADFENAYYEGLEAVNNLGWLDDDNDRIFIGPVEIEKYK
jgi:hypothetical protein